MAREIRIQDTCDWHAEAGHPHVPATTERAVDAGTKANDLCDSCAMLWDFITPRYSSVREFLDILPDVHRRARTIELPPAAIPKARRKAIEAQETSSAQAAEQMQIEAAAPEPPARRAGLKSGPNGAKKEGVHQVICPLPHKHKTAVIPYHVTTSGRSTHAGTHNLTQQDINWGEVEGCPLTTQCDVHEECRRGQLRFPDEGSLKMHILGHDRAKQKDPPAQAEQLAGV